MEAIRVNLHIFSTQIYDICDVSDGTKLLLIMVAISQKKHCLQTNCKFCFINQLIPHIKNIQQEILIICREGPVIGLLCALV